MLNQWPSGKKAKVIEEVSGNNGAVSIYDERWNARTDDGSVIPAGAEVEITRNDSLILYVKEINGDISEEYDVVVPLDEKDKKILEFENKLKEMEVRVNEYARPIRTDDEINKSSTNVNEYGKSTTKAINTTIPKSTK